MASESSRMDHIVSALKGTLEKGRVGFNRQAHIGKLKIDVRQLSRDRSLLLERMGRELFMLMEQGSYRSVPQFEKAFEKIREIDTKLAALNEEVGQAVREESRERS